MMDRDFFRRGVLEVAPELVGMTLVRTFADGSVKRLRITETEAYAGAEDSACYAHKGRTKRSEMLYRDGGTMFVHLCYGMYWMLNIVTGPVGEPQGVLIRGAEGYDGPGKLTKALDIGKSFDGADVLRCPGLRLEDGGSMVDITCGKRIGIAYAAPEDQEKLWRFTAKRKGNG